MNSKEMKNKKQGPETENISGEEGEEGEVVKKREVGKGGNDKNNKRK